MSDTPIRTFKKDPVDDLTYAIDWSAILPAGETLQTVVWGMPVGLTLSSQSQTSTVATARVTGGTADTTYRVTCTVTTTPSGFDLRRSIAFRVLDR